MDYQTDFDTLYGDAPAPVTPRVTTPSPMDFDALYADAPVPDYYTRAPKKPKESGGVWDEAKRGLMTSFVQNNPQAIATAMEGFNAALGGADDNMVGQGAENLSRQVKEWIKANPDYKPTVPQMGDIHGVYDAAKYAAGAVGSTIGSFALPAASAALGAGVGSSVAPGPGTAVGAIMGGLSGSYAVNYADVYDAFREAGLDKTQSGRWAAATAVPVTALDSLGEWTVLEKLVGGGAKREVLRGIGKRIAMEAAKGAGIEGGTEALQEIVKDIGLSLSPANREFWTKENFDAWVENGLQGAIGGGVLGGVGGVRRDRAEVKPDQVTAVDNKGEGDSAGIDAKAGQAGGQPTPGGAGTPAPPPVKPMTPAGPDIDLTPPVPKRKGAAAIPVAPPVVGVDQDNQAALAAAGTADEEADVFDEAADEEVEQNDIAAALRDPTAVPTVQPTGTPVPAYPEPLGTPEAQAARAAPRPEKDQVQAIVDAAIAAIPAAPPVQTPLPTAPVQPPTPTDQVVASPAPPPEPAPTAQAPEEPTAPEVTQQVTPPVEQPPVVPPAPPEPEAMPVEEAQAVQPDFDAIYATPPSLPPGVTPAKTGLVTLKRKRDITPPVRATGLTGDAPGQGGDQAGGSLTPDLPGRRSRVKDVTSLVIADIRSTLDEHPRDIQDAAIHQAVGEVADEIDSRQHESVGAAERALREPIRKRAAAIAAEMAERRSIEEAAGIARGTLEGVEKAREVDAARRLGGEGSTGQTREREGKDKGKSAEAIEQEARQTFFRRVNKELKKPDPPAWAVEAKRSQGIVAANVGRSPKLQAIRDKHNAIIDRIRREQVETAKKAQPPKPTEDEAKAKREQERIELEAAARLSPVEREQAQIDAEVAKHKEKHLKHDAILERALKEHPVPQDMPKNEQAFVTLMTANIKAFVRALTAEVGSVARVSIKNSKAENFVAYAKGRLANPGSVEWTDVLGARLAIEAESQHQFWSMIKSDPSDVFAAQQALDNISDVQESQEIDDYLAVEMAMQFEQIDADLGPTIEIHNRRTHQSVKIPTANRVSVKTVLNKGYTPYAREGKGWNWDSKSFSPFGTLQGKTSVYDFIRKVLDKRMLELVGDVPVFYANQTQINTLMETSIGTANGRTRAFYSDPSIAERSKGAKGIIVLSNELLGDPELEAYVIRHELVHALTVAAIKLNIDGIHGTIKQMAKALEQARPDIFNKNHIHYQYGSLNPSEFIAEAMSNPAFQQILIQTEMPEALVNTITNWKSNFATPTTFWEKFLDVIGRLIGLQRLGKPGRNYLEAIIKVSEHAITNDDALRATALRFATKFPNNLVISGVPQVAIVSDNGAPRSFDARDNLPFDPVNENRVVTQAAATIQAAGNGMPGASSRTRRVVNALKTITQIAQDIGRIVGENNPARRVVDAVRRHGPMSRANMVEGDALVARLMSLGKSSPAEAEQLAQIMHDATTQGVDPTVALTHDNNKHISKKGVLDTQKRARHAALAALVARLSPDARKLMVDAGEFYRRMQNKAATSAVHTLIEEMDNKSVLNLPPNTSKQDLQDWVLSGGPDRLGTVNETSLDKTYEKELGATVKLFKNATGMRLLKGYYTPLMRRGDYVISAKREVAIPANAKKVGNNQLVFTAKKDAVDFLKTNDQILTRKPQSIWYDPVTGKRITSKDAGAKQAFVVTIQDDYMEAFEKLGDAKEAQRQMRQPGSGYHSVKDWALRQDLYRGTQSLMPQTAQKIIDRAKQHVLDPTVKKAVEGVITRAVLEQMAGTRIQRQRLLRRNVLGASTDATRAMRDYNVSMSNHLSTLELRPQLNAAMAELDKAVEDARYKGDGSGGRLSELQEALRKNIEANDNFDPSKQSNRWINAALTISFLKYLASPAHSIINSMQVGMVSLPYLASRHGFGRAVGALTRSYWAIGSLATLKHGAVNVGRTAKGKATVSPALPIIARVKAQKDGAALAKMLQEVADVGLISHDAGMELDPATLNKNAVERGLGYASEVVRAIPEAIEDINRSTTAIAAYRLAVEDGRTHEQAVSDAIDAVNDTQGDYSSVVAPRMFKNPYGKLVFQFKKYPQMMGRLITRSAYDIARGESPAIRKQAAKQLAYLSVSHAMVAGLGGLPFMEVIKMLAMFAAGLGFSDDDWESWENKVQGVFNDIVGNKLSEVAMRGLPRLVGVDLSNRMGLDSLMFFGSPRSFDASGIKSWLFDSMAGAPLGVVGNAMSGIANNDWSKILPLPKLPADLAKAIVRSTTGQTTPAGRRVAAPYDVWPAILQTLGIQPAVVARQFEHGGSGAKAKEDRRHATARQVMMGRYTNARTPVDRQEAWQYIRTHWNAGRPAKERITMEALQKAYRKRVQDERKLGIQ